MHRHPVIRGRTPGLLPVEEQRSIDSLAYELHTVLAEELSIIGVNIPFDLIKDYTEHVWRQARAVPILRPTKP